MVTEMLSESQREWNADKGSVKCVQVTSAHGAQT